MTHRIFLLCQIIFFSFLISALDFATYSYGLGWFNLILGLLVIALARYYEPTDNDNTTALKVMNVWYALIQSICVYYPVTLLGLL